MWCTVPAVAGIVLLKNARRALPLDPARLRRVVLVGPHANASEHMLGNYYGRPSRIVTPLQAFQARMSMLGNCTGCPHTQQSPTHPDFRKLTQCKAQSGRCLCLWTWCCAMLTMVGSTAISLRAGIE